MAPLLFLTIALFCLSPWASPASALTMGVGLALTVGNPWAESTKRMAPRLLQVSVVMLGFGMNLPEVLRAGLQGALFAALTIAATLALGWVSGRALGIRAQSSALISAGTAICGGSAIAAVASVIAAGEAEISIALGTVFLLNALALYVFPPLGHALHLSQVQFGTWAGVAIHDISSVVGAATLYGPEALQVATAVKLSRSLWILPVALAARAVFRGQGRSQVRPPWFIAGFVLAALMRGLVPEVAVLAKVAGSGLTLTLFLIGSGLSLESLRRVGPRPLLQGLLLWVFICLASLAVVLRAA